MRELLNHLVCTQQQFLRNREAESPGVEIYRQLELRGLSDGKTAGFAPRRIRSTNSAHTRSRSASVLRISPPATGASPVTLI